LRVIYPAPETCLDLASWQEFYGFDKQGQQGLFDIKVDTENYTLQVTEAAVKPMAWSVFGAGAAYVESAAQIGTVTCRDGVSEDFFGKKSMRFCLPGPFAELKDGEIIKIDPRKTANE